MTQILFPSHLRGTVVPPPSKSQAHRMLIAAALADGVSSLHNMSHSKDIDATVACLEELGAEIQWEKDTVVVHGMGASAISPYRKRVLPRLDCGESGSTLRFLIPVALAVCGGGIFTGHGRLMERPLKPYFDLFEEKGIFCEQKDGVLTVRGHLSPGEYRLPGNVSSQFFTGLLFALPLLEGPSVLTPTTPLESEGYLHMTLEVMAQFGVELPTSLSLPPQYFPIGEQTYSAAEGTVEGDWSQAGFWYAAKALGNEVDIISMNPRSTQGDKENEEHYVNLSRKGDVTLDVSSCPDLVPPLAVMAAVRCGTTRIVHAERLRIKESDRLASVTDVLCKLGAHVEEGPDFLVIHGREALVGGVTVDSHNDHRIAMMTAVAATRCGEPVTLRGARAVEKSYPSFWNDYVNLGGCISDGCADELEQNEIM